MEKENSLIWKYQEVFQIAFQNAAEPLFETIDSNLNPNVSLIAVWSKQNEIPNPIRYQSSECKSEISLIELNKVANEIKKRSEQSHEIEQNGFDENNNDTDNEIEAEFLKSSLLHILSRTFDTSHTKVFGSLPVIIENFHVFVILTLRNEAFQKYDSLSAINLGSSGNSISFIKSIIETFLRECASALENPNGRNAIKRSTEELLVEAALDLMRSVDFSDKMPESPRSVLKEDPYNLFDNCNTISALKYEGKEGLGKIIIAKATNTNIRTVFKLSDPIRVNDFRKVRKLLEISRTPSQIICDGKLIYGFGKLDNENNPNEEHSFEINFISHYKWELLHNNKSLMVVEYRKPSISRGRLDKGKFYSDLKDIFLNISNEQIGNLWDITSRAVEQKHGTMLVISDKAEEEAKRLGKPSFAVDPFKLVTDIIDPITSIDGAVLVDRNCNCHAFGVILDGSATDKDDSSRGARYNSAIRYYEQQKLDSLAIVVISEDGMINIIPTNQRNFHESTPINPITPFIKN